MARFNRDPHGHRQEASRAFELEFLSVARGMAHAAAGTAQRRIPQRGLSHEQVRELEQDGWLDVLTIYQECIRDREHVHLKATRWASVAGFVRSLRERRVVEVKRVRPSAATEGVELWGEGSADEAEGETEDSAFSEEEADQDPLKRPRWFVRITVQSPQALMKKRQALDAASDQEHRQLRKLESVSVASADGPVPVGVFVKRAACEERVATVAAVFADADEDEPAAVLMTGKRQNAVLKDLQEEIEQQQPHREAVFYESVPRDAAVIDVSSEEEEGPWLQPGLLVRVANAEVGEGRYYGRLGVVEQVVEAFGGQVALLDGTGHEQLLLDQDDCGPVGSISAADADGLQWDARQLGRLERASRAVLLRPLRHRGQEVRILRRGAERVSVQLLRVPSTAALEVSPHDLCIYYE